MSDNEFEVRICHDSVRCGPICLRVIVTPWFTRTAAVIAMRAFCNKYEKAYSERSNVYIRCLDRSYLVTEDDSLRSLCDHIRELIGWKVSDE